MGSDIALGRATLLLDRHIATGHSWLHPLSYGRNASLVRDSRDEEKRAPLDCYCHFSGFSYLVRVCLLRSSATCMS